MSSKNPHFRCQVEIRNLDLDGKNLLSAYLKIFQFILNNLFLVAYWGFSGDLFADCRAD